MVCQPKDWSNPEDGGYLLNGTKKKIRLIRTRSDDQLQDTSFLHMPVPYHAVNALQRVPWRVNRRILNLMLRIWREGSPENAHLFVGEPEEDDGTGVARVGAYLNQGRRFAKEERFWFPCNMDFRGRIYCIPTFSPQNHDMIRGMLEFADAKPCSAGYPVLWLRGYGYTLFYGKREGLITPKGGRANVSADFVDRVKGVACDPLANRWWTEAKEPWQFLAWCLECAWLFESHNWTAEGSANKQPWLTRLPVFIDQHASGLQHLCALARSDCEAALLSMKPSDDIKDIYNEVVDAVLALLGEQQATEPLARKWISFGVDRKLIKRFIMVRPYNAGRELCRDRLRDIIDDRMKKTGKRVFAKKDVDGAAELLQTVIWDAMDGCLPETMGVMKWLGKVAETANNDGVHLEWTSPLGFPIKHRYFNWIKLKLRPYCLGIPDQIQFRDAPAGIQKGNNWTSFSPNFVHSLDATVLAQAIYRLYRGGIHDVGAVHDCVACHPGNIRAVEGQLKLVFAVCHKGSSGAGLLADYCEFFHQSLPSGDTIPAPQTGTYDIHEYVKANSPFL